MAVKVNLMAMGRLANKTLYCSYSWFLYGLSQVYTFRQCRRLLTEVFGQNNNKKFDNLQQNLPLTLSSLY
jgi:hypothetical protein